MRFLLPNVKKEVKIEEIEGGKAISVPAFLEVEAKSCDELGLRYSRFFPTLDENDARKVATYAPVGVFDSLGGKGICGYATYY